MIPRVSGKTGKETIGRFGVGFYTVLAHLKKENDFVRIKTSDGTRGHVIEFRIHERSGDIFVHTERDDSLSQGTNVQVEAEDFDATDAEILCLDLLECNDKSEIILNEERINTLEGFETIRGENTSVKFTPETSGKSKISLLINGVRIEHFEITGVNVCRELVLDFPLDCSLPENRSELEIDEVAVSSLREMIDIVLHADISDDSKVSLCNSLDPLLKELQQRSRMSRQKDNLSTSFYNTISDYFEKQGKIFLPNEKEYQMLDVPNAIYVNSSVCKTNLEKIPGVEKCHSFYSNKGYSLYTADLREGVNHFVAEINKERLLIIDRGVYERHRDCPAALNAYFSSLDPLGKTLEINKGKIMEDKYIRTSDISWTEDDLDALDINEESRGTVFMRASEESQRMMMREVALKRIEVEAMDGNEITSATERKIIDEVKTIITKYETEEWNSCLSDIKKKQKVKIFYGDLELYYMSDSHLKSIAVRKNPEFAQLFIAWKQKQRWRDQSLFLFIDALCNLHSLVDMKDQYSEQLLFNFLNLFADITEKAANNHGRVRQSFFEGTTKRRTFFERVQKSYIEKLWKLQDYDLEEFVKYLTPEIRRWRRYKEDVDINTHDYSHIPHEMRGYVVYAFEGRDLLSRRSFDEASIQLDNYEERITLSTLVQAKKDAEGFFQDFEGTPAEIVEFAKNSQRGIDPSKAMRDIMHSTNNQISNNNYLWLRELLQNSLDAVKEHALDGADEPPGISVNAFIQNKEDEEELIIEAADPIGMDIQTIINYLLIPNESSKKENEELTGKFGQGFFTVFGNAKEVLIKTSKGDGRVQYMKIAPIKDAEGQTLDFDVEMSEKGEMFTGTVIHKIVDTDMPEVEAGFCKGAVMSYGGLIDRNSVRVDFGETEINTPKTVLAQAEIPSLGGIRILDSKENAMTQSGLFIKMLDNDLLAHVPPHLRKELGDTRMVVDIPKGIHLVKSRGDIARKKEVLPLLQEQIPSLVLQAYLELVKGGKIPDFDGVPYQYFEFEEYRQVPPRIKQDANKIIAGKKVDSYESYLQERRDLKQLLTLVPCISVGEDLISLNELAKRVAESPDSIDINSLPESLKWKVMDALQKKEKKKDSSSDEENEDVAKRVCNDLPDDPESREKLRTVYAFDYLARSIFELIGAQEIHPQYYSESLTYEVCTSPGNNKIGFNLSKMKSVLEGLEEIIEEMPSVESPEAQRILEEIIKLATHARQHHLENTDKAVYNYEFFERQRVLIQRMIENREVNFEQIFSEMYEKFSRA